MTAFPPAITRLDMPEYVPHIGLNLREAERELENAPTTGTVLDATYADTVRFPPPKWALPTFQKAASGEGMTYTPYRGDRGIREAVAQNIEKHLGIDLSASGDVILTPGTQGALFIALASLLEQGDKVILPEPDYLSTARMIRYFGAEVLRIPLSASQTGQAQLDPVALKEAAGQNPKLMIFSHPNNPTGLIYDDHVLEEIAHLARTNDFYLIADQLYCRLVYDGLTYRHIANIPGMAERTITLLGPSKTESLSGYRLGVAVGPQNVIDRMEDVQSVTALRAPAYAQHLLRHWLADDQEFLAARISEYQALRDMTVERLQDSGLFEISKPQGSAYVFPKYLVNTTDRELTIALKTRENIVVNPGYQSGLNCTGSIRLCFAQEEKVWDDALDRIIGVVRSYA